MRIWLLGVLALVPCAASAQSIDPVDLFEGRVRPLFAARCHACHGPKMQMAGLDLSTAATFARGSDSGPIVSLTDPAASRLLRVLAHDGKVKMPPTGRLSDEDVAGVAAWVRLGAPWPKVGEGAAAAGTSARRDLWSLHPVARIEPPAVGDPSWIRTPVDRFVLAKLEPRGIRPAPPAGRLVLLRRATFDLTGLPPTEREIDAFLADRSPDAFARVVERLLASPRYGERWGRHWLDVARYADSTGLDEDHRYPHAWRYRDWVIDAFNSDLPYDRFVTEQLAGDILASDPVSGAPSAIVATGFLALGPKPVAQQDKVQMVYDVVDEQIEVASKAFLGLTVACARCHDHKFDSISTRDYYGLASIFASTKSFSKLEGTVSQFYTAPLVSLEVYERWLKHQDALRACKRRIDDVVEAEAESHAARLRPRLADYMLAARAAARPGASAESSARERGLDPAVLARWVRYLDPRDRDPRPHLERWVASSDIEAPEVAAEYQRRFDETTRAWSETFQKWRVKAASALENRMTPPEKPHFEAGRDRFFAEVSFGRGPFALPEGENEREARFGADARERLARLRAEYGALGAASPPEPPMADAVAEGDEVRQRVFIRGSYANPGPEVEKGFPAVLCWKPSAPIARGSGRLELARWLTDPSHPLVARVMANRIWQWHFGEGIVRTPSNYGTLGEPPTDPELLDYLAARFVESGWSVKAMHRLLMLSSVYQTSSLATAAQKELDPANRLWSRFNRRRLSVEEIRDGLLSLDGALDSTMGGTLQTGTGTDGENDPKRLSFHPDSSRRRTVYLPLRRSNLPSLLNLFDFGDATTTSEGRARTNVAPQALYMINSSFVHERARALARVLVEPAAAADDRARLRRAYRIALGRPPTPSECDEALRFMSGARRPGADPDAGLAAWPSFCRVLVASNEFLYVD